MPRFLLLTGIIILLIAGGGSCTLSINADSATARAVSWCVIQHDSRDPPACYENLITCEMVALAHASSCTQRPRPGLPSQVAANQRAHRAVQLPGHGADASPRHHKLTAEERDELYRKFQQWRSTHE
jgi:hypothetical protein